MELTRTGIHNFHIPIHSRLTAGRVTTLTQFLVNFAAGRTHQYENMRLICGGLQICVRVRWGYVRVYMEGYVWIV